MDTDLNFGIKDFLAWGYRNSVKKLKKKDQRFEQRSANYQTTQKLFDCETRTEVAVRIRNKIDMCVLRQVFIDEDYRIRRLTRYADLKKYCELLVNQQKRPLILDLGANSGMASLYFSREFTDAQIIALEPDVENFNLAKENNRTQENVTLIQAGISCENGKGKIFNRGSENWAFQTEISETGDIKMLSVNEILHNVSAQNSSPFIAKIDIEGFERNLFSKNTEWVDKFPLIIIELHDWMLPNQANAQNFLQCVSALNRDFVFYGENVFSIKNNLV